MNPEEIGLELSNRLKKSIESIPDALLLIENQELLNLEDIDKKKLIKELTILTYVGQRLAVQFIQKKGGELDESKRREICNALDSYSLNFLENSSEFNDLLDQRGGQYFQLLQSHNEEISNNNWEKFFEALQFEFEQFCRGGGDYKKRIIIGRFTSMMPLMMLANQYWSYGFIETAKYIKEQVV
jgi:hypothetical protein